MNKKTIVEFTKKELLIIEKSLNKFIGHLTAQGQLSFAIDDFVKPGKEPKVEPASIEDVRKILRKIEEKIREINFNNM